MFLKIKFSLHKVFKEVRNRITHKFHANDSRIAVVVVDGSSVGIDFLSHVQQDLKEEKSSDKLWIRRVLAESSLDLL